MAYSIENETTVRLSTEREQLVEAAARSVAAISSESARWSGLVWRPGRVVTADEALPEDGEIKVAIPGSTALTASTAGRDATTDVALLRVEEIGVEAAPTARATPKAGAGVLVVGANAEGPVVASGIVSHSGPAWQSLRGGDIDARLELDVRLPETAEGGLVLDAAGDWIGMAVFGPRRRVLVIPAATIDRVAATLEMHGRITRGYLGLGLQRIRLDGGGQGLLVANVDSEGPGHEAGVHQGDILTGISGEPIRSLRAVLRDLGPQSIGRVLSLAVRRGGAELTVSLTVGQRPER